MDPGSLRFGITDEQSAQVLDEKTLEAQSEEDEVNSEMILINHFTV